MGTLKGGGTTGGEGKHVQRVLEGETNKKTRKWGHLVTVGAHKSKKQKEVAKGGKRTEPRNPSV